MTSTDWRRCLVLRHLWLACSAFYYVRTLRAQPGPMIGLDACQLRAVPQGMCLCQPVMARWPCVLPLGRLPGHRELPHMRSSGGQAIDAVVQQGVDQSTLLALKIVPASYLKM
jgi:hypothetical protein